MAFVILYFAVKFFYILQLSLEAPDLGTLKKPKCITKGYF